MSKLLLGESILCNGDEYVFLATIKGNENQVIACRKDSTVSLRNAQLEGIEKTGKRYDIYMKGINDEESLCNDKYSMELDTKNGFIEIIYENKLVERRCKFNLEISIRDKIVKELKYFKIGDVLELAVLGRDNTSNRVIYLGLNEGENRYYTFSEYINSDVMLEKDAEIKVVDHKKIRIKFTEESKEKYRNLSDSHNKFEDDELVLDDYKIRVDENYNLKLYYDCNCLFIDRKDIDTFTVDDEPSKKEYRFATPIIYCNDGKEISGFVLGYLNNDPETDFVTIITLDGNLDNVSTRDIKKFEGKSLYALRINLYRDDDDARNQELLQEDHYNIYINFKNNLVIDADGLESLSIPYPYYRVCVNEIKENKNSEGEIKMTRIEKYKELIRVERELKAYADVVCPSLNNKIAFVKNSLVRYMKKDKKFTDEEASALYTIYMGNNLVSILPILKDYKEDAKIDNIKNEDGSRKTELETVEKDLKVLGRAIYAGAGMETVNSFVKANMEDYIVECKLYSAKELDIFHKNYDCTNLDYVYKLMTGSKITLMDSVNESKAIELRNLKVNVVTPEECIKNEELQNALSEKAKLNMEARNINERYIDSADGRKAVVIDKTIKGSEYIKNPIVKKSIVDDVVSQLCNIMNLGENILDKELEEKFNKVENILVESDNKEINNCNMDVMIDLINERQSCKKKLFTFKTSDPEYEFYENRIKVLKEIILLFDFTMIDDSTNMGKSRKTDWIHNKISIISCYIRHIIGNNKETEVNTALLELIKAIKDKNRLKVDLNLDILIKNAEYFKLLDAVSLNNIRNMAYDAPKTKYDKAIGEAMKIINRIIPGSLPYEDIVESLTEAKKILIDTMMKYENSEYVMLYIEKLYEKDKNYCLVNYNKLIRILSEEIIEETTINELTNYFKKYFRCYALHRR